jgi:hypothetical protein
MVELQRQKKEKVIYAEGGEMALPRDSEAMQVTNKGDRPVEGYILRHGVVERPKGKKLDFFIVKYYFEQVSNEEAEKYEKEHSS